MSDNTERDSADWLQEPFTKVSETSYKMSRPKVLDDKQGRTWQTFHFATRLKLEGATYFCRQIFGSTSMPDSIGLPLLAHRQQKWYLDAFFFELMASCDTLLQELNVLYLRESTLDMEDVRWTTIKSKLPTNLVEYAENKYQEEWFKKIRNYRNVATHYAYVPTGSMQSGFGSLPINYEYTVSLFYVAEDKITFMEEDISVCKTYLQNMVEFVRSIWHMMAQEYGVS